MSTLTIDENKENNLESNPGILKQSMQCIITNGIGLLK